MTRLVNLVGAVVKAEGRLYVVGNRLRVEANTPLPEPLRNGLRQNKMHLMATLRADTLPSEGSDTTAWKFWYEARALFRLCTGWYSLAEAQEIACRETINLWHRQYSAPDPALCAGCGEWVGRNGFVLPDGARVHLAEHLDCLVSYGQCWRPRAIRAVAAMGIPIPLEMQLLEG